MIPYMYISLDTKRKLIVHPSKGLIWRAINNALQRHHLFWRNQCWQWMMESACYEAWDDYCYWQSLLVEEYSI